MSTRLHRLEGSLVQLGAWLTMLRGFGPFLGREIERRVIHSIRSANLGTARSHSLREALGVNGLNP